MNNIQSHISKIDVLKNTDQSNRSENARNRIDDEKSKFLKLFIAQIQNQIPTEPMENKDMSQLTAVFAQVEQQIDTNKNLEKILKANEKTAIGSPISYLGAQVSTDTSNARLSNGKASFSYNLSVDCDEVIVDIFNDSGKKILTQKGGDQAGYNEFIWNGTDENNVKYPDGNYKIDIHAKSSNKSTIPQSMNYINLKDSQGIFNYQIPDDYIDPSIIIKNDKNDIIIEKKLPIDDDKFFWDGKNNDGFIVSDNNYNIFIKGRKLEKNIIDIEDSKFRIENNLKNIKYDLNDDYRKTVMTIYDDSNKEVFRTNLETNKGLHEFLWNGLDNQNQILPRDREYMARITSFKNNNQSNIIVNADTIFTGIVNSIDNSNNNPILNVDGKQIALDKIRTVSFNKNKI